MIAGETIIRVVLSFFLVIFAIVLQSSLAAIGLSGVYPDLALVVLVYIAYNNGAIVGQTVGFASGLIEDTLSLSPLGFHALMHTVIGFMYGNFKGKALANLFVESVLLTGTAMIVKMISYILIGIIFSIDGIAGAVFSWRIFAEIGLTIACAPFVFMLLRRIAPITNTNNRQMNV